MKKGKFNLCSNRGVIDSNRKSNRSNREVGKKTKNFKSEKINSKA